MNFIVEDTKLKGRKDQFSVEVIQIMMWKSRGVFRQIDVSQLQEVGVFDHKVDVENQTLITHKCVFGALNRQFLVGVVMCCPSFIL